jgi:hypothetical protein
MTDPTFRAKVRPELHPAAAKLVAIYEAVPGALTYPGAMPEGIAAVLDQIAGLGYGDVADLAALLRGEQP